MKVNLKTFPLGANTQSWKWKMDFEAELRDRLSDLILVHELLAIELVEEILGE